MAGVWKRKSDKARGKSGKWSIWYFDAERTRRTCAGFTDKAKSLELAHKLETDARLVANGMLDPAAVARKVGSVAPVAAAVAAYGAHLLAKGDTPKHAKHAESALARLLKLAGAGTPREIAFDRVQAALAALKAEGKSARTVNFSLAAVKAFVGWLEDTGKLDRAPRGFGRLAKFNEKADQRHVRRSLTRAELAHLLATTAASEPEMIYRGPNVGKKGCRSGDHFRWLTGPQRAALYRLAMGTGARADEIRTLTPDCFYLDGVEPFIRLKAEHTKNGQQADQPITTELAAALRPFLEECSPGVPVLDVPIKTADLLRRDLARAGIEYRTADGVIDFHALRVSFITLLILDDVNPKVVQHLARHSSITLTLDRYAKLTSTDVRAGLERKG